MEKGNSKNILVIVIVILILVIVGYFGYTQIFNKDNNSGKKDSSPTPVPTAAILTDDEAIKVAKSKLDENNNFFGTFKSDNCSEDNKIEDFCYYDTTDNFNKKFYGLYSKELNYDNVLHSCKLPAYSCESNYRGKDLNSIGIKYDDDTKIYISTKCIWDKGNDEITDKFTVNSKTNDKLDIGYTVMVADENGNRNEQKENMILVKEDGDWKILNAAVIGNCGYIGHIVNTSNNED